MLPGTGGLAHQRFPCIPKILVDYDLRTLETMFLSPFLIDICGEEGKSILLILQVEVGVNEHPCFPAEHCTEFIVIHSSVVLMVVCVCVCVCLQRSLYCESCRNDCCQ